MAEQRMEAEESTEDQEVHYPYVVRGATIYCSCGTHMRKLDMPVSHGSYIRDQAMMNKTDCKVGLDQNIPPFGACLSESKDGIDIKIEDTKDLVPFTDEEGNPIEMPVPIEGKLCEPDLDKEWADAQEETLVDGKPAITVQCTVTCKYGGVIGFMDAGQGVY
jgi:hypothetical protein